MGFLFEDRMPTNFPTGEADIASAGNAAIAKQEEKKRNYVKAK